MNCEQAVRLLLCLPTVGLLCDYLTLWLHSVLEAVAHELSSSRVVPFADLPDHMCADGCGGVEHAPEAPVDAAAIEAAENSSVAGD